MLQIRKRLVGRAIIDDDQFNCMPGSVATDALNAALQIFAAIMCQQIDRKLKLIRGTRMVRSVSGTGKYSKLFFHAPGQDERAPCCISDGKTLQLEIFTHAVSLLIA